MTPNSSPKKAPETRKVITAFLQHDGRILLVRRSQRVGTYQGKWSGISGYLEHEPLRQALIEIQEEVGLNEQEVELLRRGESLEVLDPERNIRWLVYPFLFKVKRPNAIQLDWENVQMRWILPAEIDNFPTVPALKETLAQCLDQTAM